MTPSPQTPFALPVVSFVGKSDSGKTTFLEKVIALLTRDGVNVATVKHHTHPIDVDVEGKDSWRHAQAGARVTMIASPYQYSVIRKLDEPVALDVLAEDAYRAGADILISEGYKSGNAEKIEVSRMDRSDTTVSTPEEIIALVTDNAALSASFAQAHVPVFTLDDAEKVAWFIRERYLGGEEHESGR